MSMCINVNRNRNKEIIGENMIKIGVDQYRKGGEYGDTAIKCYSASYTVR